jgi:hypothetical protein
MWNRRKTVIAAVAVVLTAALSAGLFLTSGRARRENPRRGGQVCRCCIRDGGSHRPPGEQQTGWVAESLHQTS